MSAHRYDVLFSPLALRHLTLPNRFVRSATYEGMADAAGIPQQALTETYVALALGGVGTLITGFVFVSPDGRALPGQCGIETDDHVTAWQHLVSRVREVAPETRLIMQLVHAGRQTTPAITGHPVVGASTRKSRFFRHRVHALTAEGILRIVEAFARAAYLAKAAGFDGVQLHAAHGYLIHQFLSPWTNTRRDHWGEPTRLLDAIIHAVRERCGEDFPVLVKLSVEEDSTPGLRFDSTLNTVMHLESLAIDAVETSYGSMDEAFNIIRGAIPIDLLLDVNPLFSRIPGLVKRILQRVVFPRYRKQFLTFQENYTAEAAARLKQETTLPIIPVGGIRTLDGMLACLTTHGLDAVSLCRPLIREPNLPNMLREQAVTRARCTNCNYCTIHCTAAHALRCYRPSN